MDQRIDTVRPIDRVVRGQLTSDGAGVRLTRLIGTRPLMQLDPFLLLDAFGSDDPDAYIGGFPPHPHRGFETVTYLLAGRVRHEDNAGHAGVIEAGGVQWMTAGRGVVHSEMPEQEEGRLAGFQLWVNLPAAEKMGPPRYQEFDRGRIPVERREGGVELRVVAGVTDRGTEGPVRELVVPVRYLDLSLPAGGRFEESLPEGFNAFLHPYEGRVRLADEAVEEGDIALLGGGSRVVVEADVPSRLLLVAGEPIGEPVARHGPFVMNTQEELKQAYLDLEAGRF